MGFGHFDAFAQIPQINTFGAVDDFVYRRERPAAKPIAEQSSQQSQQGKKFFFDEPEAIESLVEGLGGNGGIDLVCIAVDHPALTCNAVLLGVQVSGQERRLVGYGCELNLW